MNLWIPPLLAQSVLRKESAASSVHVHTRHQALLLYSTRALYGTPIAMYVTFTVIPYYGHGVNYYVNFFMTATVHCIDSVVYRILMTTIEPVRMMDYAKKILQPTIFQCFPQNAFKTGRS